MTSTAPSVLTDARPLIDPALQAAVDRLDPTTRAVAAYHLGWTDEHGEPVEGLRGGKALRPALALLSARAVGAPASTGLPGAVAVELVHNFSLLHDDLMDGDLERRHRPTVWALWGPATAILTGDALLTLAQQVLLDEPGPARAAAARLLNRAGADLIRGQVDDVAFERRHQVGVSECVRMADGKTAALLGAAASIGAVLAGAESSRVAALGDYGRHLGVAFQIVDDLLGIWGDPAVTGKPVRADLRARKKTLPITYAACSGGPAAAELAAWLATEGPDSDADLDRAAELVERAGGTRWAREQAHLRVRSAEAALDGVGAPSAVRDELLALTRFVVGRQC